MPTQNTDSSTPAAMERRPNRLGRGRGEACGMGWWGWGAPGFSRGTGWFCTNVLTMGYATKICPVLSMLSMIGGYFTAKTRINPTLAARGAGWRGFFAEYPMSDCAIDLDHLARYTGGDKALNAEILRLFDGQVSEMVTQLLEILEERDGRKWRQVTHTIKGAARGVGAFAMGNAAADAEPVDPVNNPERAIEVIESLRIQGEVVQVFIAQYLAA
jgi:HPt (histidine-containing phosphotransfer) domain-containing protein